MSHMTTFTGAKIVGGLPYVEQVSLVDIGCSLAKQCRFLGHGTRFYSVAQHSIIVARIAQLVREGRHPVRAAFAHDFHEAYCGDVPSPNKDSIRGWRDFENDSEALVRTAFLQEIDNPADPEMWHRVRTYDLDALHWEAAHLFRRPPEWHDGARAARVGAMLGRLNPLEWQEATIEFFRFAEKIGFPVCWRDVPR